MPQSVVDADNWTVTVECAADGDPVNGASQLLPAQDLADRTRFIRERTLGPAGGALPYRTPLADYGNTANLSFFGPIVHFAWWQTTTGGLSDYYSAPLYLPPTGKITKVYAITSGNGGGGGPHVSLPAVMPRISLYKLNVGAGSTAVLTAQANDPSGTIAIYDAWHELPLAGLALDIGTAASYWVVISAEGGAGALPNAWYLADLIVEVEPAP